MRLKIKKSLSFVSFLILTLGGIVLPIHQAQAIVPLVGAGIAAAVVYIGGWIMQAVSTLSAAGVVMMSIVLQWTLRLDWPYTSDGIVAIGWPIVRDLTNIFFVVILVAIGLATALRIEGYQAKKTLRNLVLIILLVNFTPVIAGLIVDASNIVMNFFTEGLDPGAYIGAHLSAQHSIMPPSIWEGLNPFKEIEQLLGSLVIIMVDLVVLFIFMVFAFLFLTRYVAIWILVILSPIAFASYILPATRSTWKMWWNNFLQWCIIGATTGFFLYLGTMLLSKLDEIIPPPNQGFTGPADVFINLMPLVTVAIFYGVGLFVSLSSSAMGAKGIISSFKKGGKAAGKAMALQGWKGMGKTMQTIGKTPANAINTYKTARVMGKSQMGAFGAAVFRPKRFLRQWKPSIPKKPLETYKTARSWGIPRKDALYAALKKWNEWEPAGPKARATARGVGKAIKDIGMAGLGGALGVKAPKKKGQKPCPNCKKMVAANAKQCTHPGCGFSFE